MARTARTAMLGCDGIHDGLPIGSPGRNDPTHRVRQADRAIAGVLPLVAAQAALEGRWIRLAALLLTALRGDLLSLAGHDRGGRLEQTLQGPDGHAPRAWGRGSPSQVGTGESAADGPMARHPEALRWGGGEPHVPGRTPTIAL